MCKKKSCPIYRECDKSKEQMVFCKEAESESTKKFIDNEFGSDLLDITSLGDFGNFDF